MESIEAQQTDESTVKALVICRGAVKRIDFERALSTDGSKWLAMGGQPIEIT